MSGSPQPNYKLLAQAGARVVYDGARGVFVPTDLPANVEAVGAAAGDVGEPAVPDPVLGYQGDKCFVCFCEDQTTKDLKYAIAEGFDSIELSKRYTTVTMGPCQGRLCHVNSIRVYAKATGLDENTIGTTTARPPHSPITLGLLAGRPQEPVKRTSLHHRHEEHGATMMWTGAWKRPHSYGPDAGAEAKHVHEAVGLIDVSTLGKILVTGPDAGAFLDRVYPNRFSDLKVGRIRYGVLTGDAGRIMDDGTVARLDDETFYVTTTSTGADGVYQWFTWWNAVWFMDVRFVQLTGSVAAMNVAGPQARELMTRVSERRLLERGRSGISTRGTCGSPACPASRSGSASSASSGTSSTSRARTPSTCGTRFSSAARDLGAAPFGLEPQRILRLEKGHVIVGQDTDSESNLLEAAMPWLVKNDKDFEWVGKWATQQVADRGLRWMLVGFESPSGAMPVEGGQVIVDGVSAGRVTSVRHSAALGKVIGLAIVPQRARGRGSAVRRPGRRPAGRDARPSRAVLRSRRRAAQGMSASSTSSRRRSPRDEGGFHPVARSAAERLFRAADATFEERGGWLVPTAGAGRGRASRPGRHRRSVAPRHARRPPGAACRPPGRRRHDVPSLAEARARRSTRSPRARPSGSRSPATRSSST